MVKHNYHGTKMVLAAGRVGAMSRKRGSVQKKDGFGNESVSKIAKLENSIRCLG